MDAHTPLRGEPRAATPEATKGTFRKRTEEEIKSIEKGMLSNAEENQETKRPGHRRQKRTSRRVEWSVSRLQRNPPGELKNI